MPHSVTAPHSEILRIVNYSIDIILEFYLVWHNSVHYCIQRIHTALA